MVQTVGQINQLTQQIAQLNGQVSNLQNVGENAGTFIDQRQQAIDQLSALVDVSVIPSDNDAHADDGQRRAAGDRTEELSTDRRKPIRRVCMMSIRRATTSPARSPPASWEERYRRATRKFPAIQTQLDTLAARSGQRGKCGAGGGLRSERRMPGPICSILRRYPERGRRRAYRWPSPIRR